MTTSDLKAYEDREIVLSLNDGERLRARVCFVDFEYEDIIIDVLQTDQPEHYKGSRSSYTIPAQDILTVESCESPKTELSS